MHIDFAPPSNGTYNNAGSSRQLANYLEHEDLERMEKGLYTCLLYTSPSPRDGATSRMPSSA